MFSLQNKIAVITGGGSGIGKAICTVFALAGANVHILELNSEAATQTVKEIITSGGQVMPWPESMRLTQVFCLMVATCAVHH